MDGRVGGGRGSSLLLCHHRTRRIRLIQCPSWLLHSEGLAGEPGNRDQRDHGCAESRRRCHDRNERGKAPLAYFGVTVIFWLASHAAECVGSSTARSVPPSSRAMVNVTFGVV